MYSRNFKVWSWAGSSTVLFTQLLINPFLMNCEIKMFDLLCNYELLSRDMRYLRCAANRLFYFCDFDILGETQGNV